MDLNYLEEPVGGSQSPGHVLCLYLRFPDRERRNPGSDDLLSDGKRGDPALYRRFYHRQAEKMV